MGAERLTTRAALALLLALAGAGCRSDASAPPDPSMGDAATVERVNDGDTLTLADGAKVRLVQIDAPELSTDCYGRPAHRALIDLVPRGTAVTLVRDPELDDHDQHGRLLRYVFVDDRNANVELVAKGAASPYYFRGERGGFAEELDGAVEDARTRGAGYWGACPGAALDTGRGSITGPA